MKWIVDGEREFLYATDAAEYITENMGDDVYDDMLDECYGDVNICGIEYSASLALYRVDQTAYRCGMNDYYDGLSRDISDEIENMQDGETTEFYGFTVEAIEDAEEED